MIDSRRPNSQIYREDVQRLPHETRAIIERRPAIQLRRRHPEPLLRIYPHGIDPQQTFVADENGHGAVGGDLENVLPVRVAGVDVPFCVDGGAACVAVSVSSLVRT